MQAAHRAAPRRAAHAGRLVRRSEAPRDPTSHAAPAGGCRRGAALRGRARARRPRHAADRRGAGARGRRAPLAPHPPPLRDRVPLLPPPRTKWTRRVPSPRTNRTRRVPLAGGWRTRRSAPSQRAAPRPCGARPSARARLPGRSGKVMALAPRGRPRAGSVLASGSAPARRRATRFLARRGAAAPGRRGADRARVCLCAACPGGPRHEAGAQRARAPGGRRRGAGGAGDADAPAARRVGQVDAPEE